MGRSNFFVAAVMVFAGIQSAERLRANDEPDPFLWLEDIETEEVLDWVRGQNDRTQTHLESDPRFQEMYDEAREILTSDARLPLGSIHEGMVYNLWQDGVSKRGLWRRTTLESYREGSPDWETVIDFDELAEKEQRNWIPGAIECLTPVYRRCMIELSDGGKDAGFWREFDTQEKVFVSDGFALDEAKSTLGWINENTLIVGSDWGDGSLTTSGYPRTLRVWQRGADLADAPIMFEGEMSDVSVSPYIAHVDDDPAVFIIRRPSFFEREYYFDNGALSRLPLPVNADLEGVIGGRAVFFLREEWRYREANYATGSVIAYDLSSGAAELIMEPTPSQSVENILVGETGLVVQYLEDVSGRVTRLLRSGDPSGWDSLPIAMPDNGVVSLLALGGDDDAALISFESMTTPDTLFYVNGQEATEIAATPEFYDASDVVVEQRFATSADGTQIPYFVMAKKEVLEKGNAPTVQYGYGGFLAATLPVYYSDPGRPQHGALGGKLWVSRGGVLVLSNIRGGSEYGPAWHQAALKENRQRAFDDFIAISEHLIASGVTRPEKLGIIGRSNGGLLMGAMLTQRPDLYNAIDIGVPLFDMKRYNKLLAGASWMGEYGNPDIDDEWAYIAQYSPYQKLSGDSDYPKVLFYTSTKDDRVHPGHARKAAAKLNKLGHEFFYYENIEGGHGGTANQEQLAYRTALEYAYFAHQLMGPGNGETSE